jgi:hypothetical protein
MHGFTFGDNAMQAVLDLVHKAFDARLGTENGLPVLAQNQGKEN